MTEEHSLLTGSVPKKLTVFAFLLLLANILQSFYNVVDMLVAGMLNQFGTAVSAASNVGLQINTFAGMPCWAIGQAVTVMVGQCMGAGQIERTRKVVKLLKNFYYLF